MIYSDRQYAISSAELTKLRQALTNAREKKADQNWLIKAELSALKSQISDIENELAEYDLLKTGQVSFSKAYALEELPKVLVQARIAKGMSQTDLADALGLKPQQIQRYEATNYMSASLARLIDVSRSLGVSISETFEGATSSGASVFMWRNAEDVVWGQLPYKEMLKRKWFDLPRDSNPIDRAKEYFLRFAGPQFATAYHRKKVHSGNVPNEFSLLAWQARILERASSLFERNEVTNFELNDAWLGRLASLTTQKDGAKCAKALLAEHGIALVFERHLPGTYLDGAAMLDSDERPVIGMTLRYDRLDNFWFVLFHELGHVFLHLFDGLRFDFFDEGSASPNDPIEEEADRFALNTLIPDDKWDQCLSRFALSAESVAIDAENLGIDASIIAGRIRKELNNYTILGDLVGQGRLRPQFTEEANDLE